MRIKALILSVLLCGMAASAAADSYEERVAAIAAMPEGKRTAAISRFIKDTGKDDDSAAAASQALENMLLGADSPIKDEGLYILFAEEMLRSGYPNRVRNEWMLKAVSRNRPGQMLPEFDFEDRNGTIHSSAELRGHLTMLMFYDPDCSDCSEAISRLSTDARINESIDRGDIAMVCIYADGDRDLWLSEPGKVPSGWTDGIDTGRIADEELFVIPMTPTIYLIGPEGRILLKEADVEDILNFGL